MGLMVGVKIIGKRKLDAQLKRINRNLRNDLAAEMVKVVDELKNDGKIEISTGGRSGRLYKRGNRTHQASAPGEYPKTDTGKLVLSFFRKVIKSRNQVTGFLINNAPHARYLEFKPASMGGRPFMRPLWKKWKAPISARFKKVIRSSIRKEGKK